MNTNGLEIERKYLIAMPDQEELERCAQVSRIVQTYLLHPSPYVTARVRRRGQEGDWHYYHTEKTRISDRTRIENEREIDLAEYEALLAQADPERNEIHKLRWVLPWKGQSFEIDIYPFWDDRAIMEIELEDEEQSVEFPPQIRVLREVTADVRYTNSALSKAIPMDELEKGNQK